MPLHSCDLRVHILIEIETSRALLIIDRIVHKTGVFSAELVGERSSKVDEVAENLVGKQVKVQLCSESAARHSTDHKCFE